MKCILCGNTEFGKLYDIKNYKIIECLVCHLVMTKQSKNANYRHYHRDDDYLKFESHFKNIFRKRFNLINRFAKKHAYVCDIGASTGTMLDIFASKGWKTWGIEPSESALVAKKKGHKIIKQTLEKAKLPDNYFDAVVINHTLEHVDNPVSVLKKVKTILKKGGIVLVDVPNFGSMSSQKLKRDWPLLLPEEHNFQFTKESLAKVFATAGLSIIYHESRSGIYEFASPLKEMLEAFFSLKKRFIEHVLTFPQDSLATLLDKGDSLTMIGRKR